MQKLKSDLTAQSQSYEHGLPYRENPPQTIQVSEVRTLLWSLVNHERVYLRDESLVKGKFPDNV